MENKNLKTSLCSFWLQGICNYMNIPEKCLYAHGEDDSRIIECKYENNCVNSKCPFFHKPINRDIKFDLLDFVKNKKIKNKLLHSNINNNRNVSQGKKIKIIDNIGKSYKIRENISESLCDRYSDNHLKQVKIYKKNGINQDLLVYEKDFNKLLNYVDIFYLKKMEKVYAKLDNTVLLYDNKIKNMENTIHDLNKIIKEKENKLENVMKDYNNIITDSNKKNSSYKIDNLENTVIKKYYDIGKLLIEQNNKLNVIYINKFFNCKNISMIKNRCTRIYRLISYMQENNIKKFKSSLRNIFHMNNNNFLNNLKNNLFFI